MVKHLFEGNLGPEDQAKLVAEVTHNEDVIEQADALLQKHASNDDLAIMIVNIIICFNSISNKLETEHVRQWV